MTQAWLLSPAWRQKLLPWGGLWARKGINALNDVTRVWLISKHRKKSRATLMKWNVQLVLNLKAKTRSLWFHFRGKKNKWWWMKKHGNSFLPLILQQEMWVHQRLLKKFPPFSCCFRRSNKVPWFLVLFTNERLITGRLRLAYCLPRLFFSHRKAWDNICPTWSHVGAEPLADSDWMNQRGRELAVTCWVVWTTEEPPHLTRQLILNVEVKAEVEFKEQPEGA